MKRVAEFAVSLALGGLLLFALLKHFDARQTLESVRQARPSLLALGLTLMVAAYLLRGARWQIWERSLGYWSSLRLILIGFMGNNVLPGRLGEVLRAHCTAAKLGGARGRTAALGSVAAERILDGFVLGIFGLVAIRVARLDHRLQDALFLVSFAFAILTAALVLSFRHEEWIRNFVRAVNRRFPGRVTAFARDKAAGLLDGVVPLGTVMRMLVAITATAIIWCTETASYYCIGLSVWDEMNARTALLFLVVVNFASLVPLTMGGIGTIEAAGPLFLISSGVSPHIALAMVLLQHTGQYLFTTIIGGILYLAGGFHRLRLTATRRPALLRPAPADPSSTVETARSRQGQLSASGEMTLPPRGEIELSIVIPAYNEQERLPRTVLKTIRWCAARSLNFELIIVDDGSRDNTLAIARLFEESNTRVRTLACPHMGKGAAVRTGILDAKGQFVLFMDADAATPLDEIPKLLTAIEAGNDLAIGSRAAHSAGEVEVRTPLYRRLIGRTFAFFVNLFAFQGIADTQCGFKMFRRETARAIFSRQKTPGFAFDVEILLIARRSSLRIAEIPVNWVSQPGSKVNLVADSIRMLWDISRLRWLHRSFKVRSTPTNEWQIMRQRLSSKEVSAAQDGPAISVHLRHPAADGSQCSPRGLCGIPGDQMNGPTK
jgi:dolichyl-phosphate beta-glucosyltransferase